MIRSMTAFARVNASAREGSWVVEIKSLNHRYFEFSLKVPPALNALENRIRDFIQPDIRRGKVMVGISQDASNGRKFKGISIDESAVRFYTGAVRTLRNRMKLEDKLSVGDLLRLPGIFTTEQPEEDAERSWEALKRSLAQAVRQLIKAKEDEGRKLAADVHGRLNKIARAVGKIERLARSRSQQVYKKLSERVDELLAEKEKDPDRVCREVAFLAERSDITEEIVRLKSHLGLFRNRLKQGSEIGRELDFICQEMNREINTVSSKAQLFAVSTEAILVKGELEKIREQIQNIE